MVSEYDAFPDIVLVVVVTTIFGGSVSLIFS